MPSRSARRLVLAIASLGPVVVSAQTLQWTGGAANWNTTDLNWKAGGPAIAWSAPNGDGTSDLTAEFFFLANPITINGPVSANRLSFVSDNYVFNSAGPGVLTLAASSGGVAPSISVIFEEQRAVINAPIAGSADWTKEGRGTLVLSGANTFTGALLLADGTVRATRADALGAGVVQFAPSSLVGPTLELANDTGLDFGRAFIASSSGTIVSDRLTAGAGVTHTLGTLAIDAAFFNISAGANVTGGTAGVTFGAASLGTDSTLTVGENALLTLASLTTNGRQVNVQGEGDLTISGSLQSTNDNSGFNKYGGGTLTLLGASNTLESFYLTGGSVVVAGGTVAGRRADILGAGGAATISGADASWTLREDFYVSGAGATAATMTVSDGATLSFRNASLGDSGNTGRLVVTGAGSRLEDTAAFPYTGLTVGGTGPGSLEISAGATASSSSVIVGRFSAGSVLLTGAGSSWTIGSKLYLGYESGVTGSLTVADGATGSNLGELYVGLSGAGSLTLKDAGTKWTSHETISVYAGDVTVADGATLQSGPAGLGDIYFASGTTGRIGTGGAAGILIADGLGVDGALVFDHSDNLTLTPYLFTGSGTITKQGSGTLTLQTNNSAFGGAITVSGGTLRALGNANALGSGTLALAGGNVELAHNSNLAFGRATTLAANSTVTSNRGTTNGAGVTHSLGTLAINGAQTLSVAKGSRVTSGTAGVTFGATTLSANGATFDTASGTLLTLGALGGNYSFEKKGAGQLTLGTASTRTSAATTLSDGILRLTNTSALGTAQTTFNLNGGTLQLANNTGSAFNGTNLVVGGDATLVADRTSSATTSTTHTVGTLSIGARTLSTSRGGNITSGGIGGIVVGATTLTGSPTFSVGANSQLTLGAIGDGGSAFGFTKSGSGTLAISAANTFTGGITLSGGTVQIGGDNSTGTLAGAISGNGGALTKSGTGTLTLSGNNTYTGATTVSAGTLVVTRDNALGASAGGTTVSSGASLALQGGFAYSTAEPLTLNTGTGGGFNNLSGDNSFAGPVTISGLSRVLVASGTQLTLSGQVSGSAQLSFRNGGTLVLSNSSNSFFGALVVNDGTLVATANGALGNTAGQINVNSGGTLAFSGGVAYSSAKPVTLIGNGASGRNGAIDNLSGDNSFAGPITLSDPVARIGAASGTRLALSGVISEAIAGWGPTYAGPGAIKVTGANTYTGATTLAGGTLVAGNVNAFGSGSVLIDAGTFDLGGFAVANSVHVRGGSLTGTGAVGALTIQSGGTLAPGNSPGLLTVNGPLTLDAGSFTHLEIAGATRGATGGYDAIDIGGLFTPGGTLTVSFSDGYTPSGSGVTIFDFFNFTSIGATMFSSINLPTVAGYTWNTDSLLIDGSVSLVASAIPEPGAFAVLAGAAALGSVFARRRRR